MKILMLCTISCLFIIKARAFTSGAFMPGTETDTTDVFKASLLKQFTTNCEPNIILTAIEQNQAYLYWAANSIRVSNDYRIVGNSAADITMKAGEVIVLGPNTAVLKGNDYLARIEPCELPELPCPSADEVFIPKGVSPNGDGYNDAFDLSGLCVNAITIFNRYGMLVYQSDNYVDQWHGQTGNNLLPTGTYFYTVTLSTGERVTGWVYLQLE